MFPSPWCLIWAPHWPASGNVELRGWTNSLFSVRQAVAMVNILDAVKHTAATEPQALIHYFGHGPDGERKRTQLSEDISIVENMLDRSKVSRQ